MNFEDLVTSSITEEVNNLNEENIESFFSHNYPITHLYGNTVYNLIYESGDWYLLGDNKSFSSLKKAIDYINEEYDDMLDTPIEESLAYAKFKYKSANSHDPRPKVLVLDNDYIYNGHGKIVPGQHDILAINLNYSKQKKLDKQAVDEITTFAHMVKKNKQDIYKRIKAWRPDVVPLIRHYKPENMRKLKKKDGWFWRQCSVADLKGDEDLWNY